MKIPTPVSVSSAEQCFECTKSKYCEIGFEVSSGTLKGSRKSLGQEGCDGSIMESLLNYSASLPYFHPFLQRILSFLRRVWKLCKMTENREIRFAGLHLDFKQRENV